MRLGSDRNDTADTVSSVTNAQMQYVIAVKDGKLVLHLTTTFCEN